MLIRYFAEISDSPVGKAALAYARDLVATKLPVRLISSGGFADPGTLSGDWARYVHLLNTPLEHAYLNVVCTESHRWCFDTEVGKVEIYTPGVRNVLLVPKGARPTTLQRDSALRYDAIVAHPADMGWWLALAPRFLLASNNPQAIEIAISP